MLDSPGIREHLSFIQGNVLVLTITRALGQLSRSMAFPYASLYILALGGSPEQIGLITALSPLAGLIVFPLGGHIADHVGRVKVVAVSGYVSSAILLLYVLAPSWQILALATLLRGLMVIQFPASSAILVDSLAPENRGKGVAVMNTIAGTLALVAPYLAGLVLETCGDETGMRVLYGVMTAIYLTNAVISHHFLRETSDVADKGLSVSALPDAFREAYGCIPDLLRALPTTVKAVALICTLGFVANAVASPYWVVYATDTIELSTTDWGLILLIEMGLRTLVSIPAGVAVDRYGRTTFIRAALLVAGIAMPLYLMAGGFVHVLLIRAAIGVAQAIFLPASAALMADALPRDVRGRAMAVLGRGSVVLCPSSGGTGGPGLGLLVVPPVMLGSLLGGYLYERSPALTWFTSLGAVLVALVIAVIVLRDPEQAEV
jgi:MFS family permease